MIAANTGYFTSTAVSHEILTGGSLEAQERALVTGGAADELVVAIAATTAYSSRGPIEPSSAANSAPEFVGPLIGRSGYKTTQELSDAAFTRYQNLVDRASARVDALEQAGALTPPGGIPMQTWKGILVDRASSAGMRNWAALENLPEGSGKLIQVQRRLYDPLGTSYRVPDVQVGDRIFDATLGVKTYQTPQIVDFGTFSGGSKITVVRPSPLGGSNSILP